MVLTGARSKIIFDELFQLISHFVDHFHMIDVEEIFVAEVVLLPIASLTFPFGIDIQQHQMIRHGRAGELPTNDIDLVDLLNRTNESTDETVRKLSNRSTYGSR